MPNKRGPKKGTKQVAHTRVYKNGANKRVGHGSPKVKRK
jgi:hypothetical protein